LHEPHCLLDCAVACSGDRDGLGEQLADLCLYFISLLKQVEFEIGKFELAHIIREMDTKPCVLVALKETHECRF
jgi:hypothetical protein